MDNKQALIIIILLATILSVLLAGHSAAVELFDNIFWLAVFVFIVIGLARTLRCAFSDWLARGRAIKLKNLHDEREQLCKEISTYPTPRLTSGHIPQQFPLRRLRKLSVRGGREGEQIAFWQKLLMSRAAARITRASTKPQFLVGYYTHILLCSLG